MGIDRHPSPVVSFVASCHSPQVLAISTMTTQIRPPRIETNHSGSRSHVRRAVALQRLTLAFDSALGAAMGFFWIGVPCDAWRHAPLPVHP